LLELYQVYNTIIMNILTIFADQMHKYAMGCMGNPDIHTPCLDSLADEGVLFKRAYSNNPICSPFRVHLMTGLYSSDTHSMGNECVIPPNCLTLPDQFKKAGYLTSYVGKWHVGGKGNGPIAENLRAGFDRFIGYQCYNGFIDDVCFYDEQGTEIRYDYHRTNVTADMAIERLNEIKDKPFIQYVCFQAPHYPEEPSEEYYNIYKDKTISKNPDYVKGIEPYTATWSPPSPKPKELDRNFQQYGGDMDEYLRCYYGMVSQIDANVGRLLDYLKENNLWENTAVFFFSDHGDMQGSHGLTNKCTPWEKSSGIPFIARIPGGLKGDVSQEYISGVDTYPTFLELAGIENGANVRGKSFLSLLKDKSAGDLNRMAFSEGPNNDWVMLCRNNFKLVADRNSRKPTMLFNLEDDPWEMNNLVDSPQFMRAIQEMHKALFNIIDDSSYGY
jgi:arylsulfatase A-like enzyme